MPLPAISLVAVPGRRRQTIDIARDIERRGFSGIYTPSMYGNMSQCEAMCWNTERIPFGTAIAPIYARTVLDFAQSAAFMHEASGEQMKLSGAVPDEIKKGKLVIKKIDWVHGSPSVSAPSTQGFMDLMLSAAQAIKASGATYRVDVYMDKKYSEQEIATLGAQRTTVIVSSLQGGAQLGEAVLPGKIGKDKEQRVEIVKVK